MAWHASPWNTTLADPRTAAHTSDRQQPLRESKLSRPAKFVVVVALGAAVGILSFFATDSKVAHPGHDLGKATAKFMAKPMPAHVSSDKAWVSNGPATPTMNEQTQSRPVIKQSNIAMMSEEVSQLFKGHTEKGDAKILAKLEEQLAQKEEQSNELAMRLHSLQSQIQDLAKDGTKPQQNIGFKSTPIFSAFAGLASMAVAFAVAWATVRTSFGHGQQGSESVLNSQLALTPLMSASHGGVPAMRERYHVTSPTAERSSTPQMAVTRVVSRPRDITVAHHDQKKAASPTRVIKTPSNPNFGNRLGPHTLMMSVGDDIDVLETESTDDGDIPKSSKATTPSFTAELQWPFGLQMAPDTESQCLKIKKVEEGGIVAEYNSREPFDKRILPGDFIVELNGNSDLATMVEAVKATKTVDEVALVAIKKREAAKGVHSSSGVVAKAETRVLPAIPTMLEDDSVGITGRWKEVAGNFVKYPKDVESNPPQGVIHFLGGAFVGAAPHYTYRYLLDSLCDAGYIVVTTPYRLKFDYLMIIDRILSKLNPVLAEVTKDFGVLPVIGIGHSCGALLHTLISSRIPNENRAANVLISFNNKPVTEAIPAFDELVVPISRQAMGASDGATRARESITAVRGIFDSVLEGLRTSDRASAFVKNDFVPAVKSSLEVVDQVPELLASIAAGTQQFTPSPENTREAVRESYGTDRTLLIQFENDAIDETPKIENVLRERMHMKESTEGMEVKLQTFDGTHITPLTQNVVLEPPAGVPDPFMPLREELSTNFLRTVNDVNTVILEWLKSRSWNSNV